MGKARRETQLHRSIECSSVVHMASFRDRVVIDSSVHFGKPCVAGTRIPVEAVLELVQEGIPFSDIIHRYYPDLTVEDVKACVQFATALIRAEEFHLAGA